MKKFLALFLVALSVGCASTGSHEQAARAYEARVKAISTPVSRLTLKVPDGSELKGGFELTLGDPAVVPAYTAPESPVVGAMKEVKEAAVAVTPWVVGGSVLKHATGTKVVDPVVVDPVVVPVAPAP